MQGLHGNKHWDKTCIEVHCDNNYTVPEASSPHFFLGKHEAEECTCQYGKSGSQNSSCHRDQRCGGKAGKLKHLFVIFKVDSFWNNGNGAVCT